MMKEKQKTNRILTIVLILGTVTVFFPLYMAAIIAFKKPSEMTNDVAGALSFPKQWSFENFRQAMEVTDFKLQLRCPPPETCKTGNWYNGGYDLCVYRRHVVGHYRCTAFPDRDFQFRQRADQRRGSCLKTLFCRIYFHGSAIHRTDHV